MVIQHGVVVTENGQKLEPQLQKPHSTQLSLQQYSKLYNNRKFSCSGSEMKLQTTEMHTTELKEPTIDIG